MCSVTTRRSFLSDRSSGSMQTKRPMVAFFVAATMLLVGCNHSKPKAAVAVSDDARGSNSPAQASDELNRQIVSALQDRRYSDAVTLARRGQVSQAESDFAVGEIILQGH